RRRPHIRSCRALKAKDSFLKWRWDSLKRKAKSARSLNFVRPVRHLNNCSACRRTPRLYSVAVQAQQRCIAAGRRGVDRIGAFEREFQKVVRATRFWSGSGEPFAAERL